MGFKTLSYIYSMFTRKKLCFFECGIWNPLVYIIYVSKKKVIFSMWDLKPFCIYTLCSQEKSYIFQYEIWSSFIHVFYIHKKKLCFFNVEFETLMYIYSIVFKKKVIFSIWDLKSIRIYTICSQEKSYVFSM